MSTRTNKKKNKKKTFRRRKKWRRIEKFICETRTEVKTIFSGFALIGGGKWGKKSLVPHRIKIFHPYGTCVRIKTSITSLGWARASICPGLTAFFPFCWPLNRIKLTCFDPLQSSSQTIFIFKKRVSLNLRNTKSMFSRSIQQINIEHYRISCALCPWI